MAKVFTVTYSDIRSTGLTVTVTNDDGTFVTDHPVKVSYTSGDTILYDFPERLPDFVFPAVAEILRFTEEYEKHIDGERVYCNAVHPMHSEVNCEERFGHANDNDAHFNSFYMRSW